MAHVHERVISESPKIWLKINVKNLLGQKCIKSGVRLTRIDDLFYSKPIIIQGRTSNGGYVKFDVMPKGVYLVEILSDNVSYQEIIDVDDGKEMNIKIPTIIGIIRKIKKIDKDVLKEIYEKNRNDVNNCFFCTQKYEMLTDRFLCNECMKYYCEKHMDAKKHECFGNHII